LPFKTFADTNILNASDVNTYLMKQSVIVCTSSTRPSSPNEGMSIYETDTDRFLIYSGTAWTLFLSVGWIGWDPPTLSFGGSGTDWSFGNSTFQSGYFRTGNTVIARMRIAWGSTAVFGTKQLGFNFPVPSAYTFAQLVGSGIATDTLPTSTAYPLILIGGGARFDVLATLTNGTYAQGTGCTSTVPFTWASTDSVDFILVYEAA